MADRVIIHPTPREIASPAASQGIQATFVEVVSRGVGVDVPVPHGLRRIPYGAMPITSVGEVRYDPAGAASPNRLQAWTDQEAFFQPQTAAGTRHRFFVF